MKKRSKFKTFYYKCLIKFHGSWKRRFFRCKYCKNTFLRKDISWFGHNVKHRYGYCGLNRIIE